MSGLFGGGDPALPQVEKPTALPTPTDSQSQLASRRAIARRIASSGRASTALSKIKEGL